MFWKNKRKKEAVTHIGIGVCLDNPLEIMNISIPDKDRKRHTFIIGTTGVGKTRLAESMIDQDIRKGNSVVFFDPKGDQEIFSKIYEVAADCGRKDDLMLVTPVYPEYSAVIDPLAFYFYPEELVNHIISGIKAGKEPYYRETAKTITMSIVMANILLAQAEGRPATQNIELIRQCAQFKTLGDIAVALESVASPEAIALASTIRRFTNGDDEHFAKVSSSLQNCLNELTQGNIGKIIGQADSNRFMERLEQGRPVILVVQTSSMIVRESGAILGKIILSMIQSFVGRVYGGNRKCVTPPLAIYIDEAQSLLYEGAEELFSKAGSADVMITAFTQSVQNLYAVIGEDFAKAILDNTNTKIFMRCVDAETAEYVVKHFGVKKVLSGIFGSAQVTTREVEQDLVRVQDILELQNQKFYMTTYSGKYRGSTLDTPGSIYTVEFPEPPARIRPAEGSNEN